MAQTKTQTPTRTEDEFFAREDAEKKRKLALAVKEETAGAERERLRALHHMRCPKCGLGLQEVAFRGVAADLCFSCGGVFLDRGEIDRIARPDQKGIMAGLLGLLR
jgi:Zn-finger nucleic acid-binding protein